MFASAWLNKVLRLKSSGDQRRGRAANQTRQVRLNLESLEDRVVPAAPIGNTGATLGAMLNVAGNTAGVNPVVNAIAVEAAGLVLWINAQAGVLTPSQLSNFGQQLNAYSVSTTGQSFQFNDSSSPFDIIQSLRANEQLAGISQSQQGIQMGLNLSYNLIFKGTT